jgi:hypothetical protein
MGIGSGVINFMGIGSGVINFMGIGSGCICASSDTFIWGSQMLLCSVQSELRHKARLFLYLAQRTRILEDLQRVGKN